MPAPAHAVATTTSSHRRYHKIPLSLLKIIKEVLSIIFRFCKDRKKAGLYVDRHIEPYIV
ncbi:hypothetical protein MIMGU_mgv11b014753mg [Erythranthe guttata]|uniref:Uncharacterized protein n=1 Tax=Erythranthe guttata TaxID=4155 RepID=A0A022QNH9_ERYGU|nr:hypothetical protein MIMGU_mgv11b014753mg [Erythranthe guttata]